MSTLDFIEKSKENVQPVRKGRDVARTAFALSNHSGDALAQQER